MATFGGIFGDRDLTQVLDDGLFQLRWQLYPLGRQWPQPFHPPFWCLAVAYRTPEARRTWSLFWPMPLMIKQKNDESIDGWKYDWVNQWLKSWTNKNEILKSTTSICWTFKPLNINVWVCKGKHGQMFLKLDIFTNLLITLWCSWKNKWHDL